MAAIPLRTYGDGFTVIEADEVNGEDSSTEVGGSYTIRGGDHVGGGAFGGGSITIRGGNADGSGFGGDLSLQAGTSATGTGGSVVIEATRPADDGASAVISMGTEPDYGDSSEKHMTVGFRLDAGGQATVILKIKGPENNGENMKLRVWATGSESDSGSGDDQMTQLLEQTIYRSRDTTSAFPIHQDDIEVVGAWPVENKITVTFDGTTIELRALPLALATSEWMLKVEWQRGGMAAT